MRERWRPGDRESSVIEFGNIQGNSLIAFGRPREAVLLWAFEPHAECRRWVAELRSLVTSCEEQLTYYRSEGRLRLEESPVWMCLGFSYAALPLVLPEAMRATSSQHMYWLESEGFAMGEVPMLPPGACLLAAALSIVAAESPDDLDQAIAELASHSERFGVHCLAVRKGLRRDPRDPREIFGFRDGISKPSVLGVPSRGDRNAAPTRRVQPGEFVLGYPNESSVHGYPVADWMHGGSFIAYSLFAQDDRAFAARTEAMAVYLRSAGWPEVNTDYAAAMIMGRWKDGTPIDGSSLDGRWHGDHDNFSYGIPGKPRRTSMTTLCPFEAHVLRANPRNLASDTDGDAVEGKHRILRRGMTYETDAGEKGLLFLCYQASIRQQFDWILRRWCLKPDFPIPGVGIDGLLADLVAPVPPVTIAAIESGYFFMPSLPTLAII